MNNQLPRRSNRKIKIPTKVQDACDQDEKEDCNEELCKWEDRKCLPKNEGNSTVINEQKSDDEEERVSDEQERVSDEEESDSDKEESKPKITTEPFGKVEIPDMGFRVDNGSFKLNGMIVYKGKTYNIINGEVSEKKQSQASESSDSDTENTSSDSFSIKSIKNDLPMINGKSPIITVLT